MVGASVADRVQGVLQVLAFSAIPDSTVASLRIDGAGGDDPRFRQFQTGAGFTLEGDAPIYLEGFVGAVRYDPVFVFSAGQDERRIPTRWNAVTATGGVGYDVQIAEDLAFRPIANVVLGYVASDLRVLSLLLDRDAAPGASFLDDGDLFAGGLGAAAMLDYERATPDLEIDVELRLSAMRVETIGDDAVEGGANAGTLALWSRLRWPTGASAFSEPLRMVGEFAHSSFLGPQRGALGFTDLTQVGLGLEIDPSQRVGLVKRARLVGRVLLGENVTGFGVGLGVTF